MTFFAKAKDLNNFHLLMFDDQPESWPMVKSLPTNASEKACQDRLAKLLKGPVRNKGHNSVIPSHPSLINVEQRFRPRFWFFELDHCPEVLGEIDLHAHFTNDGGPWVREFSCEQQGLLQIYALFFVLFLVGIVVHSFGVHQLYKARSLHPIVRILTITIVLETISLLLTTMHYAVYKNDGVGVPMLLHLGKLFKMLATTLFMLLLVMIARGWGLTDITLRGKDELLVIMGLFFAAYAAFFVWDLKFSDPKSTSYVYLSLPGYAILVLRALVALYFIKLLYGTFMEEQHPSKRRFYVTFGILYTIWFLSLPVIVVVSVLLPPWQRQKSIYTIELIAQGVAYGGLGFLLWPSRAHEYFTVTTVDLLSGVNTPYEEL